MKTTYDMLINCFQLISIRFSGYIMKTTNILYENNLNLFYILLQK